MYVKREQMLQYLKFHFHSFNFILHLPPTRRHRRGLFALCIKYFPYLTFTTDQSNRIHSTYVHAYIHIYSLLCAHFIILHILT